MAERFQKPSLRGVIFGAFTLALGLILGALFFIVPSQVAERLETRLAAWGATQARYAAQALGSAPPDARLGAVLEEQLRGDDELAFIAVLTPSGSLLARTERGPESIEPQLQLWRDRGLPALLRLASGDLLVSEPLMREGQLAGRVMVGVDHGPVSEVLRSLRSTVLVAFLLGFALYVLLILFIWRTFILGPLDSMMSVAQKLSEADLTGRMEAGSDDELGMLAEALNRIGQSLRETLARVKGVSEAVAGVIEQISRTGTTVSSGATTIQARVQETSSSMVEMMASLRGLGTSVEVLHRSAEQSSASILQVAASNEEVASNVQTLGASVEETTAAIQEMTSSIKEVAKNIHELYASTEETSSSINRMDASISQIGGLANETERLSEQVSEEAQTGVEALRKTLSGIDRIKETSRTASSVIESLGKRISEIGNILDVIDDVAEQTNLLALNAAIIAAQAGEHGKGFAVVAEEIKDLAERTGASTKEIAELIRGVQDESRNAVAVMGQGLRSVEEGVQLGREAEGALGTISDSAQKATQMVKAITRATLEQARGSKQVTAAIHRIAETVQQISRASSEQAKGGEQILHSAERMKAITAHVRSSSEQQARGSNQIIQAIEEIGTMVTQLNRAQKEQMLGSEQVLRAVETIKGVSEHQTRSVRQLEEAIESLQRQADVLRGEIRRFRV